MRYYLPTKSDGMLPLFLATTVFFRFWKFLIIILSKKLETMEQGEAVEPLSVITHNGISSFHPTDQLGKEVEGGPFIVSVGIDRDVRINYFIPPEPEDDLNDDDEEEIMVKKKVEISKKESPKKPSHKKDEKLNDSVSINSDDQELAIGGGVSLCALRCSHRAFL